MNFLGVAKPEKINLQRALRIPAFPVLLISLLATVTSSTFLFRAVQEEERMRFDQEANEIESRIRMRVERYQSVLLQARGLFMATNGNLSRESFRAYVDSFNLFKEYPGTLGLAYAKRVPQRQLKQHIREVRATGFSDYWVWPETPRQEYFPTVYIEPFTTPNQRAFGFDMATETVRRQAMEAARDTGRSTLSGRVILVQEAETDPQPGFLMYVAIYARGMPTDTVEQRQKALTGFVYSPFRAQDFFQTIRMKANGNLGFSVHDAENTGAESLIYEHRAERVDPALKDRKPRFERTLRMSFSGREWSLRIFSLNGFTLKSTRYLPLFAFCGGLLLSLLIYGLLKIAKTRAAAERDLLVQEQQARLNAEAASEQLAKGEESIRRSMQNLRQALRARDEFLSIASHELKTPLTSLKLQSQIIARHFQQGKAASFTIERMREWATSADHQVDKLVRLVDDMLDVSRIATGRLSVQRENLDLSRLVRETADKFSAQAQTDIRIEVPEGVRAEADPLRMEQVVTNLLSNAVKYGDGKPIELKLSQKDGDARISVTDRGIGIEPENQERIFQRFERAVPTDSISGLGLGLFISKQIVSAHGGQIVVNSKTGEGSTFTVSIPAAEKSFAPKKESTT